jgi:beta-glucosidase
MKKILFLTVIIISSFVMNAQNEKTENVDLDKIDQLISQLTLEEKASLCSGRDDWSTQPIERLNIPWIWLADGPHGLRRAPATNKAGYGDQLPATCFPTASALAASWDLDLIRQVGEVLGSECQALDVNVLLGPGVNIKRSVLGGRNFEYYSEDPILSGEMGAAFINGVQSQGVGTCLKHFAANNVETMRMFMNSNLDTRTLNEIYLTPFEIAVKKSQPWTIMACYNRVQGEYGTQNPYLLTDILRDQWGYNGVVISDWFAIVDRVEALKAGMHIEMPHVSNVNDSILVAAVKTGQLEEEKIDMLVREILSLVFKAKSHEKEGVNLDAKAHHAFARKVAAESATLLKNDHQVLPLTPKKYKKIAIIGEFAVNPRYQGNGSSEVIPTQLDKALEIIRSEYGNQFQIDYAQGYKLSDDNDFSLIKAAKTLAMNADIALVFSGLPLHYESEGIDRKHINMPASHDKLLKEVAAVQKNTVVILTNGSAVTMPWIQEVSGVLESWLGGQAGAGGITDVIFGKVNPSGKLAESFPSKLEDTPAFLNFPGEQGDVLYGERIFVGYRYYDKKKIEPMFPFGFGLSYTEFEFSELQLSSKKITDKEVLKLEVKVKNTGKLTGKEVVQIYVSDNLSSLQRPEKELKRFKKIELKPGEEKTVRFELNARDFSFFDARRNVWVAESGEFTISAASSSRDIKLAENFELVSTQELPFAFDEYTFFSEYWKHKQTREYLKELLPKWISQFVPEGKSMDEASFNEFFTHHPMIKFPYISSGEITMSQVKDLVEKTKTLTYNP